jgi:tRNA (guanine26-N2/guanine27-N2)-dimethyltransferase
MTSKIQEGAGDGPTAQVETLQEGLARFHGTKGGKVFYNRVMVVNRDLSVLMLRWFVGQRAREQEEHHRKKEDDRLRKISSTINVSTPVNQSFEPSAPAAPAPTSHTGSAQHAAQHPDPNLASEPADERVTVLDAMSATGLRALRYALEVPEVGTITANDRDAEAAAAIRSNVALCEIPAGKIQVVESDAMSLMLARAGAGELFDVIDLDPFGSASALLSACSKAWRKA